MERWKVIGFAPDGPTLFSYEIGSPQAFGVELPTGDATLLLLRARGNLDCDEQLSTFEFAVGVDESGALYHAKGFYIEHEIE